MTAPNTPLESSADVSPTIQDDQRVSENNSPDTIELLYIESSNIGLVEFRKRIEAAVTNRERAARLQGRIEAGLEFRKHMISTSPFIEQILNPYLTTQRQARRALEQEGK